MAVRTTALVQARPGSGTPPPGKRKNGLRLDVSGPEAVQIRLEVTLYEQVVWPTITIRGPASCLHSESNTVSFKLHVDHVLR